MFNTFVIQVLLAAKPYINTGAAAGPAHLALGDLVATKNGFRSLALEGFSEDVDQDGFVDPIAPAVPVAPVVTYAAYHPYALHPFGFPLGLPLIPAVAPAEKEADAVEEA